MSRYSKLCIALGFLGLLLRLILWAESIGCDDADIWRSHAETIRCHGLRFAYEDPSPSYGAQYNHPPLPGYWSVLGLRMSCANLYLFSLWMRIPGLLGEALSAYLVFRIWARRNQEKSALAFAAYGLSLPLIFVSGYHCNTDCAYAGLTLLAFYLMLDKKLPFWSGAAMAAALNVKLMPLILIPPLLTLCRSRRDFFRFGAGLILAIIPFVPFLLTSARGMYTNMIAYNSQQLEWGILAFLNSTHSDTFAAYLMKVRAAFIPGGRYLIVITITLFCILTALRRRRLGYELGALAWVFFLLLTPGYSVQYSVCALPLLFAANISRAVMYSITAGAMLLVIYTENMTLALPLHALVQTHPFPRLALVFGVLAWGALFGFALATFRGIWEPESGRPVFSDSPPTG